MKTDQGRGTGSASAAKAELRARLRAWRRGLTPGAVARWSEEVAARVLDLPEVASASACFCYVSLAGECDTRGLIDRLVARGCAVAIPYQPSREQMIACRFPGWEAMRPGALGIPVPVTPRAFEGSLPVALTPGLAFSAAGARLGHGAGYYDRWFAANPQARRIALAFEGQLTDAVPLEPHDRLMHLIVTERRVIRP